MSFLMEKKKKKPPPKFVYVDGQFKDWIEKQSQDLSNVTGGKVGTAQTSKLLFSQYIVPNNLNLKETIQPIPERRKRKRFLEMFK